MIFFFFTDLNIFNKRQKIRRTFGFRKGLHLSATHRNRVGGRGWCWHSAPTTHVYIQYPIMWLRRETYVFHYIAHMTLCTVDVFTCHTRGYLFTCTDARRQLFGSGGEKYSALPRIWRSIKVLYSSGLFWAISSSMVQNWFTWFRAAFWHVGISMFQQIIYDELIWTKLASRLVGISRVARLICDKVKVRPR